MISNINRFGKELILVGVGQVVAAVGSLVGVRLMTSALSPEVYGEIALATTFVVLSQQILIGPLTASLTRYFNFAQEKNELAGFFGSSGSLALRIGLVSLVIFLAGAAYLLSAGQTAYLGLMFFTLIFILISGFNVLLDAVQTAARQRAIVAWHQGLGQWLRYLAAFGLVILIRPDSSTAMLGYVLSAIVVLGSQLYFFQRRLTGVSLAQIKVDPDWTSRLIRYSTPFASWGIFTWMQISSDRWALQTFSSTQQVGFYTVIYQLGYFPLIMATNVFVQFAEPVLFRQAGDGTDAARIDIAQKNTLRLLVGASILTVIAVIAAIFLHPFIFELFAAPAYRSVSGLFPIMVLSGGLFACGQIASTTQLNRGESKALLLPKISMGIAGTFFNFVGAYWMGLTGVVYASVIFSGLYFLWTLIIFNRKKQK